MVILDGDLYVEQAVYLKDFFEVRSLGDNSEINR